MIIKNFLKSPIAKQIGKQVAAALIAAAFSKLAKKKTP